MSFALDVCKLMTNYAIAGNSEEKFEGILAVFQYRWNRMRVSFHV